jgi:hypothetical protein
MVGSNRRMLSAPNGSMPRSGPSWRGPEVVVGEAEVPGDPDAIYTLGSGTRGDGRRDPTGLHGARHPIRGERALHEVADGFAAIQAGDVEWEEAYDDAGEPIRGLLVRSFRRLRPAQRRLSLSGCSEANLMSSSQYEAGADRACAVAS